jgi:chromosome segregation protein
VTDVKQQYEQCKQELTQLSLKHQELMRQRETIQNTQHRSATQLESMMSRQTLLLAELEELIAPLETLEEQMQIWLEQREELTIEQQVTQEALTETENTIATISDEYKVVADKVEAKREELASVKLELEGIKVNAENQLDVLRQMEQNLGTILQSLAADAEENSWQRERDKTTSAISRLGAVNLAAVDEFEAATERKLHLDTQYQDLHDALETLEQAIRKIDRETRGRFKTTFEQVNGDFQHLFPKVFEGGSATLELTGEDLLETGVSIMAQPPGKKNSTIHLLSGGEKALAALSLVFSIFRLNPAPFCLLDEVDAPLDDANVGRFCNLVSEMSNSVQFIYITHNKIAMEMASHLTGVTMAEPGVSRMVAVDVEEAVALAAL